MSERGTITRSRQYPKHQTTIPKVVPGSSVGRALNQKARDARLESWLGLNSVNTLSTTRAAIHLEFHVAKIGR